MKKTLIAAAALLLLAGCGKPSPLPDVDVTLSSFVPIEETIETPTMAVKAPETATSQVQIAEQAVEALDATEPEPTEELFALHFAPIPAESVPVNSPLTQTEPAVPAETIPPRVSHEPLLQKTEPTQTKPTEPPHEHSYSVTSTVIGSCTVPGEKVFSCSCGASYTEEIPASHTWNQVTTEESGHWGTIACVCRCGWRGYGNDQSSAVAQYFSHVEPFGFTEERDNHSYDCVGENWIVDDPSSTCWVCSQCAAVSDVPQ